VPPVTLSRLLGRIVSDMAPPAIRWLAGSCAAWQPLRTESEQMSRP
jgi:hypothetical protein